MVKEVKKYHPDWTSYEILEKWSTSLNEAAEEFCKTTLSDFILKNISSYDMKNENAANHYLNFLKDEYKYYVTDVKRLDDTTFQATIEMKTKKTIHKVIIRYFQTKPYKCDVEIEIESNFQTVHSAST